MALISYRSRSLLHEVAAFLTLKANWFNALTVKQWEIAHSFLRLLLPSACYAGYVIVSCGMRKHLTGSSYITGTPSPNLHLVQTPPNVIMCVWATPISISATLKKKVQIPVSCSVVYYSCWHAGAYTVEPVNTDTSGSKKFCKIIGLAILPGKGQVHHTLHSHLLNSCSL